MQSSNLSFLAEFLKRRSGLHLTPDKYRLVDSRLTRVSRRFGFRNVEALLAELRHEPDGLSKAVSEAMTTNETSFFRDSATFDHFHRFVLPRLLIARARTRRLRIWCAAAATGQEAYSLAMVLDGERRLFENWHIELVATDLSSEMIARAEQGLYSQYEIQRGLPVELLLGNFVQEGEYWRIAERLRWMVSFRTFNLLEPFDALEPFDVIFCRNVLLYFDHATKAATLDKLARVLAPDGHLILGRSESTSASSKAFVPVQAARGCYAKVRAPALVAV
ncbi:MAG: protein-glutamate O-methyltransferase CheR [Proteobacteria bacterium]|nr:protein-glutamate O-methyltransferase CheR [Pseudomonadota bacterium]